MILFLCIMLCRCWDMSIYNIFPRWLEKVEAVESATVPGELSKDKTGISVMVLKPVILQTCRIIPIPKWFEKK